MGSTEIYAVMTQPVTPYIWNYQPETGQTSGAQQDYGSVINWLRADPALCSRIRNVNTARNHYLRSMKRDVTYGQPGGRRANKRREKLTRMRDNLQTQVLLDEIYTGEGQQLAGGYALGDGRTYRKLTRDNLPFPHNWQVLENGRWKLISGKDAQMANGYTLGGESQRRNLTRNNRPLASEGQVFETRQWRPISGGSANALTSYPFIVDEGLIGRGQVITENPEGLTPLAFARSFPPLVYNTPFSGAAEYFPREFSPLYDPSRVYRPSRVNDLY